MAPHALSSNGTPKESFEEDIPKLIVKTEKLSGTWTPFIFIQVTGTFIPHKGEVPPPINPPRQIFNYHRIHPV